MKPNDTNPNILPEEVVEAAYLEIAQLSERDAQLHMQRLSQRQPALLAFVSAFSEDLSENGAQLGIYMFVVIAHMFETHFGKRLQNVGPKRIESIHEENMQTLDSLVDADEGRLGRAAAAQGERQPWVWKYVVESLFEPDDEDLELTADDQGSLVLTMKTVIDAFDSSVR
jgi:hypothetical protein